MKAIESQHVRAVSPGELWLYHMTNVKIVILIIKPQGINPALWYGQCVYSTDDVYKTGDAPDVWTVGALSNTCWSKLQ